MYLDAGYAGQESTVKEHGMNPIICEKGRRNHPLTEKQKAENRRKSKTRCLVEHVFGFEEQSMHGLIVRDNRDFVRAKANVAMTNLTYNIFRYIQMCAINVNWRLPNKKRRGVSSKMQKSLIFFWGG